MEEEFDPEINFDDLVHTPNVAYNLGDLKKEEEVLISLYSKMKDQLHKLEVEELELKQKIRRKELKETTAELFPPLFQPPACSIDGDSHKKRSKSRSPRRRKHDRTSSLSHDEGASEIEETMSVASGVSQPSPVRSLRITPSRRVASKNTKNSPIKLKAAKALTIPSFEPEKLTLELDLSALSSLSLPMEFSQTAGDFVESEDET